MRRSRFLAMPFAVDLFCGLLQTEFQRRTDTSVQELVACRAQYPEHVTLRVRHQPASPSPFKSRLMGNLDDAIFATRLAASWNVIIFPAEPSEPRVPVRSPRIVNLLDAGFAAMKSAPLLARCSSRTISRAITAIGVWRLNIEMRATPHAVTAKLSDISLLAPTATTDPSLTTRRAIQLVRTYCGELTTAVRAEQIIHFGLMP